MNKLGIVLGAAAVAVFAGCMDPDYVPPSKRGAQNQATHVASGNQAGPKLSPDVTPVYDNDLPGAPGSVEQQPAIDIDVDNAPAPAGCTCPPGTVHDKPCACGAADCKCVVKAPEGAVPPPPPPAGEGEGADLQDGTTTYQVRPGDTLFLISKRFNVKLDSIRKANPQLKGDNIKVGQKITLPAKVELGKWAAPAAAAASTAAVAPAKEYKPYEGDTVDYVVKNGDCVSLLAARSGVSTRQLMELNGLKDSNIRIGQKIKLPSKGATAVPDVVKVDKPATPPKADKSKAVADTAAKAEVEPPAIVEPVVEDVTVEPPQPKLEEVKETAKTSTIDPNGDYVPYVVLKGEDITALSISFGIDPAVIRELNNMEDGDQLVPGQTIRLPADVQ